MAIAESERSNIERACRFRSIAGGGFRLALEVTRRCNLSCDHCFVPTGGQDPSKELLLDVIRQAGSLNCRKLIVTGGEPLLRHDLESIIAEAVAQGILVDLNSNFFGLTRQRVSALKTAGLQEASVSLYGNRSIHDGLTRQQGAFDRVLEGISLFREAGMTVDVHGAIWDDMLPSLAGLVETVAKLGVSSVTFFSLLPTDNWPKGPMEKLSAEMALETVGRVRAQSAIPVRTVGLRRLAKGECTMANGIYGLDASLHLKPCLLCQHQKSEPGVDLKTHDLRSAMSILDRQIGRAAWHPVCCPAEERIPHA